MAYFISMGYKRPFYRTQIGFKAYNLSSSGSLSQRPRCDFLSKNRIL